MKIPPPPPKRVKYFSLFSGIGGFELGIKKTFQFQQKCEIQSNKNSLEHNRDKSNIDSRNGNGRWDCPVCVGFSEIDKYAIQIYKKHFPTHKEYGDVTNIKWSDVPDFELLCGGFPCQSFSIAGKRRGFSDTRGTLFFEIARCASEKQPRLLFLENVKGLLSHDKGRTFGTILNTLDELGYDFQWQVLNSKNFGVPQNRERVFIVGHLRGTSRPQVFPIKQRYRMDKTTQQKDRKKIQTHRCLEATEYKNYSAERFDGILQDLRIRRLTPTECERLQGFPDGWTNGISDTQRYKCLGNAVTVNVVEAIIKNLFG